MNELINVLQNILDPNTDPKQPGKEPIVALFDADGRLWAKDAIDSIREFLSRTIDAEKAKVI